MWRFHRLWPKAFRCALLSPLFLLSTLRERLHVELRHVPAVFVPAQVPLWKQKHPVTKVLEIELKTFKNHPLDNDLSYLSKPHAVPLVSRLLGLGGVHQLEARLILLVKVGVLTATSKLRWILIWGQNKHKQLRNQQIEEILFYDVWNACANRKVNHKIKEKKLWSHINKRDVF